MTNVMIIGAIVIYMAVVIGIGIRTSIFNKSTDDFYLGGRKLGPYVTAMSAEASDMSSWLLMGLPGVALLVGGFAEAFWTAVGLALGTYLNWLFVAKRIRRYSERVNANTFPDFLSNRFGDKSGLITAVSAVIIIVFFVPYTASGFSAVGKLFNSLFGVNYHIAMIVGALVISIYTVLGGFLAASTTDFLQSIIMTLALIVVVVFGISNVGGFENVKLDIASVTNRLSVFGIDGKYSALPIASTLAWGLGYFGMPHILLRFMAIKDDKKLALSRRIASIWVVISMGIAIFIGIVGYTFAKTNGLFGDSFDAERIIIYIANELSKTNLFFAFIAGLIISGILASIMSTADSQMLAAASSVSENIVKRFIVKKISNKNQMLVARITVVLIAVIAIVFAWNPKSSVFKIVSFAWAGFGAAFGPLVLFSLFWKRTNKWGAIAGIVSGGVMVFLWKFVISKLGGIFSIYELLPAFIISAIAIVVVSLLTPAPEKSIIDDFDAVKNMK